MNNTKYSALGLTSIIALALVLTGVGPLITIWALNTLFSTGIAFTIQTWVAVVTLKSALLIKIKQ